MSKITETVNCESGSLFCPGAQPAYRYSNGADLRILDHRPEFPKSCLVVKKPFLPFQVEVYCRNMFSHAAFDRKSKHMAHVKACQDSCYKEKTMIQVQVELET